MLPIKQRKLLLPDFYFFEGIQAQRTTQMDGSLIDYSGEKLAFFLSFVLFLSLVLTVGLVTRNLENAIVFTILASTPLLLWSVMSHLP